MRCGRHSNLYCRYALSTAVGVYIAVALPYSRCAFQYRDTEEGDISIDIHITVGRGFNQLFDGVCVCFFCGGGGRGGTGRHKPFYAMIVRGVIHAAADLSRVIMQSVAPCSVSFRSCSCSRWKRRKRREREFFVFFFLFLVQT